MVIKHTIREALTSTDRVEIWTLEWRNYDIIIAEEKNSGVEISVASQGDGLPLGIVRFRPKSVEAIQRFGDHANELFGVIAAALREIGKDDLRSEHERRYEQLLAGFTPSPASPIKDDDIPF